MQTTELFKTLQDVIVPERPAVCTVVDCSRIKSIALFTYRIGRLKNRHIHRPPADEHQLGGTSVYSDVKFHPLRVECGDCTLFGSILSVLPQLCSVSLIVKDTEV